MSPASSRAAVVRFCFEKRGETILAAAPRLAKLRATA